MQLGMIGLGRMGANLVRRLLRAGHTCVVFDQNQATVTQLEGEGAVGAGSLEELVARLEAPRAAWVMVPAGVAGQVVEALGGLMDAGDVVIDGGNTYYRDDIARAEALGARGVHYLDVGTSGGVFGLERGYCLMIGGPAEVVTAWSRCSGPWPRGWRRPEGPRAAPATRRPRSSATSTAAHRGRPFREDGPQRDRVRAHGRLRRGPQHPPQGECRQPPRGGQRRGGAAARPRFYRYDFDVAAVAEVWRRGSVIGSWLLDLTAHALLQDPRVAGFSGRVSDSGEGRWTVAARSRWACPPTCSPPPCTNGSPPARRTSPSSCRPCARFGHEDLPVSDLKEPTLRIGVVDGETAVTWPPGSWRPPSCPGWGCSGPACATAARSCWPCPAASPATGQRHRPAHPGPLRAAGCPPGGTAPPGSRSTWTASTWPPTRPGCRSTAPDRTAAGGWGWPPRPAGRCWAAFDYAAWPGSRPRSRSPHRLTGRRRPGGVAPGDYHPGGDRRPAGAGRLRLAPLPPPPRRPRSAWRLLSRPHPPGAGWRPAHRRVGRRADEADPVGDRTFDDLAALGPDPATHRLGPGRPAAACWSGTATATTTPRCSPRDRVRLPGADDRPHPPPGRRHRPLVRPGASFAANYCIRVEDA